jgi:hypothetical protein
MTAPSTGSIRLRHHTTSESNSILKGPIGFIGRCRRYRLRSDRGPYGDGYWKQSPPSWAGPRF